jgi:hypothetical protein
MVVQSIFEEFRLAKLEVPPSRLESIEGFTSEFELKKIMVQELGSSVEGSRDLTTWTSIPKSMEEVAA